MTPQIHHVGYVVEDLRSGVERFAATFGAGPFFAMEHIALEDVTFNGAPARYDHSSAFGAWGEMLVELSEVHEAVPAGLRAALAVPGGGLGHVAWLADDLALETARLEAAGLRVFHTGRGGPARTAWFHGDPQLGHPVEVLQRDDRLLGFYAMVRAAAAGWDGEEPYRVMTGPPS